MLFSFQPSMLRIGKQHSYFKIYDFNNKKAKAGKEKSSMLLIPSMLRIGKQHSASYPFYGAHRIQKYNRIQNSNRIQKAHRILSLYGYRILIEKSLLFLLVSYAQQEEKTIFCHTLSSSLGYNDWFFSLNMWHFLYQLFLTYLHQKR